MNTSLKKYGITKEEYVELRMVKHCEVCGSDGEGKSLHIDHCHTSGKVRGMLCHSCNVSLGKLKESVLTLQNLIKYIEKHGQTQVSRGTAAG
jgi:predicted transcriptional regulator YheO